MPRHYLKWSVPVLLAGASLAVVLARLSATDDDFETFPTEPDTPLRPVRVLLEGDATGARFRSRARLRVDHCHAHRALVFEPDQWIKVATDPGQLLTVGDAACESSRVEITPEDDATCAVCVGDGTAWQTARVYPGSIAVRALPGSKLRLINHVDVEQYVPVVAAKEVWPSFEFESFRVQAIIARSYVLYQMKQRGRHAYDVVATPHSQAYAGLRRDHVGRQALRAARETRGLVCAWVDGGAERLFSSYYSAACGGHTQPGAIFGRWDDVPPLRGGVPCDFCAIGPSGTYRWDEVRLKAADVLDRLAARYKEFADFPDIAAIEANADAADGRPVHIRVVASDGQSKELLAERFRLAIGSMTMRSTDCDIDVDGDEVVISDGRGFGHGIGLCQWGMEGQARKGRKATEILSFYYPGSKLARAY